MAAEGFNYTRRGSCHACNNVLILTFTLKLTSFPHLPQCSEPSSSCRTSWRASSDRVLGSGMQKRRLLGQLSCSIFYHRTREVASLTKKRNVFSLTVLKAGEEQEHGVVTAQMLWGPHTAPASGGKRKGTLLHPGAACCTADRHVTQGPSLSYQVPLQ